MTGSSAFSAHGKGGSVNIRSSPFKCGQRGLAIVRARRNAQRYESAHGVLIRKSSGSARDFRLVRLANGPGASGFFHGVAASALRPHLTWSAYVYNKVSHRTASGLFRGVLALPATASRSAVR